MLFKEQTDAGWTWTARTAPTEGEARRIFHQVEKALDAMAAAAEHLCQHGPPEIRRIPLLATQIRLAGYTPAFRGPVKNDLIHEAPLPASLERGWELEVPPADELWLFVDLTTGLPPRRRLLARRAGSRLGRLRRLELPRRTGTASLPCAPGQKRTVVGVGSDASCEAPFWRLTGPPGRVVVVTDDLPLLGFGLPVSGSWATPETMLLIARRAEDLAYASLWSFQRVLSPVDGGLDPEVDVADNPGSRPADDPSYRAVHDPLIPLAFVAGHTTTIGLGTATVCAPFTPPALLARSMTSLDVLSGGRLTVGLGIGWMPQEYAAVGIPFARRGARMEEYLRCLEALWTRDPVEFEGEFYTVPRSHPGLRSVQRPHPPVLLGGAAPAALRRAGRLAQGWISSSRQDLGSIAGSVALVREGARDAGRDPAALRILVRGLVDLVDNDPGPGRRPLHGTREQVLEDLVAFRRRGVTEVFVDLNFSPRVGSPDVDAQEATAYAEHVLAALAPAHWSR